MAIASDTAPFRYAAGVFALCLVLAGGRWGSYIGFNPIFATDLLLVAAVVHLVLGRANSPTPYAPTPKSPRASSALLVLIAAWCALRFLAGFDLTLESLRDFVPYAYVLVGVLAWTAVSHLTPAQLERTRKLIVGALGFHAVWFLVVKVVYPPLPTFLPVIAPAQGLHLFEPRNDFDSALTGVMAAILLHTLLRGTRRPFWTFLAFAGCWLAVFATTSRAGLIAAGIANLLALVAVLASPDKARVAKKHLAVFGLLPMVVIVIAWFLPTTDVGIRLLATFMPSLAGTELGSGAAGTTNAREDSWGALLGWVFSDPGRAIFGVGFGPNIMTESGASHHLIGHALEGEAIPRSPHNYWVGTLARVGLVGLVLIVAASLGLLRRVWRGRTRLLDDRFAFTVAVIPVALIVPASLGVILESPFGAVPYWWCIGAVLGIGLGARAYAPPVRSARSKAPTTGGYRRRI